MKRASDQVDHNPKCLKMFANQPPPMMLRLTAPTSSLAPCLRCDLGTWYQKDVHTGTWIRASARPAPTVVSERAAETTVHVMDLWYKQENDALSAENRKLVEALKQANEMLKMRMRQNRQARLAIRNLEFQLAREQESRVFWETLVTDIAVRVPQAVDLITERTASPDEDTEEQLSESD